MTRNNSQSQSTKPRTLIGRALVTVNRACAIIVTILNFAKTFSYLSKLHIQV